MKNEYNKLTAAEKRELSCLIANGEISRACPRIRQDWINIKLSSGLRCVGAYKWETEDGDFVRLKVR